VQQALVAVARTLRAAKNFCPPNIYAAAAMSYDGMIPELQLGFARQGGYQAALGLANRTTSSDASKPWLVADYKTGLIRSLSNRQVVRDYGDQLAALNDGEPVSASLLGKGGWWKKQVGLRKKEPLAQAFGSPGFRGLDLGGRGLIVHRASSN
jgi:hypothetical protein